MTHSEVAGRRWQPVFPGRYVVSTTQGISAKFGAIVDAIQALER
jgi:hypothetical protein